MQDNSFRVANKGTYKEFFRENLMSTNLLYYMVKC